MNTARISKFLIILVAATLLVGRSFGKQSDPFTTQILPIFQKNCASCHGERVMRSGLDLRSLETLMKGGNRGPAIVPGSPEKSLLVKLIRQEQEPAMPMGGKLKDSEISLITEWIRQMAPAASTHQDVLPVRNQGYSVNSADRSFWSFVKPVRPGIPAVTGKAWVKNPIDAFVLSRLEKAGLKPSPKASPAVLVRRLYYDLTGLPPTPEQVVAFEKDHSPAAYAKLVDSLLASPRYGERWGRHWLDLARYADSGGYEFDIDRPHAWRYRDWVIKNFNADTPYNQFIIEQLAGDQLGTDSPESLIPTGFLRAGPTVDNANNEETRTDELDDMVSTTSSVFLGLTVGCARCHDHKYDPIPQRDYYRMQAVFFNFKKTEKSFASAEEQDAFKQKNKLIDEQVRPIKQKLEEIERPVKERLLAAKTDFQVRLAEKSNGFGGLTKEEFRAETLKRLSKDVHIQPEEYDAELPADKAAQRKQLLAKIDEADKSRPKPVPSAMGVTDDTKLSQAHILKRGDWRNKGDEVGPGFPQVISEGKDVSPLKSRLQLANWIASPDNPLTARVAVNRIWKYHFGTGLVKTPSDFGLTGDRPSHPELLDYLATKFVSQGWSWKKLHRLILLSNTYQQASTFNQAAAAKDPENRLLWRVTPQRLEAESIRDSILQVAGNLNLEMFGPGVYPRIDPDIINTGSRPRWPLDAKDEKSTFRRSVYVFVKRSVPLPLLEVYDCPITVVTAPSRAVSTVSPQALALMNNQFVLEQARNLAETLERSGNNQLIVDRAFRLVLGRSPSTSESAAAQEFLKEQAGRYQGKTDATPAKNALRDLCHALFNTNEFLYID